MTEPLQLKRIEYSPEEYNGLIRLARETEDVTISPMELLARNVANRQDPSIATYEGLRDGTAPWLKQEGIESFTDSDIVQLLMKDSEGRAPVAGEEGLSGFAEGFTQRAPITTAELGGGYAAYKTAQTALAAIPMIPSPPPVMAFQAAAKFLAPFAVGVYGAVKTGDVAEDVQVVLDPSVLYLPGTTADVEAGKTGADFFVGALTVPYLMGRSGIKAISDYLSTRTLKAENARAIKRMLADRDPEFAPVMPPAFAKTLKESEKLLTRTGKIKKPSRTMRVLGKGEEFIQTAGEAARKNPLTTLGAEAVVGGGAVVGAKIAEEAYPGNPYARLGLETGFGIAASPVPTLIKSLKNAGPAYGAYKDLIEEKGFVGGTKEVFKKPFEKYQDLKSASLINELIDAIETAEAQEIGEDKLEDIITKLLAKPLDPETGEELELTAATKTGSLVLSAYENAIRDLSPQKANAAKKALQIMTQRIQAQTTFGDAAQPAYRQALEDLEILLEEGLSSQLDVATNKVIEAFDTVSRKGPGEQGATVGTTAEIGNSLDQIVKRVYEAAQQKAARLWNAIPDIEITTFRNAEGEEIDVPNFIQTFDNLVGENVTQGGTFIRKEFLTKYGEPIKFILGKKAALGLETTPADRILIKNLGLERDLESAREIVNKAAAEARQLTADERATIDALGIGRSDVISTKLLDNLKKTFRNKAVELNKNSDNDSRFGFSMSDSFRLDLDSVGQVQLRGLAQDVSEAYTIARAYTRAVHDTFTRSIIGDLRKRQKNEAASISPEESIKQLFGTRNDVTLNRINDILNVGDFARGQELPDTENVFNSTREVAESIIRSMALDKTLVDPQTQQVKNISTLQNWRNQNKELLELFPEISEDLINLENANALLGRVSVRKIDPTTGQLTDEMIDPIKIREKRLNEQARERGSARRILGDASPVYEIASVMSSRNPPQGLRNLFKNLDSAKENRKKFLMEREENPLSEVEADREATLFANQAMLGLKDAFFEWGLEAGGGASNLRPSKMLEAFFEPIPKVRGEEGFGNVSVSDFLIKNNLITENEANVVKNALSEMIRYEIAALSGNLEDIAQKAGPLLDLYLRVSGAAIGTRMAAAVGGSELIAAGAGSRFMRELVNGIPNSLRQDVMLELFSNPKKLGELLSKGKTDKKLFGGVQGFAEFLRDLGLQPIRREVPSAVREVREKEEFEDYKEQLIEAPSPTAMTAPPQQPAAQVAMNMDTQPTVPVSPPTAPPASPQQRQQYAAMYPFDPVSELIRTGRG